jgi:hypothetical protein
MPLGDEDLLQNEFEIGLDERRHGFSPGGCRDFPTLLSGREEQTRGTKITSA